MPRELDDCQFELIAVSKSFRQPLTNPFKKRARIEALAGVSLRVPRRKTTCLLGPNGAGKTTLIKILASLVSPDSGEILCDGLPQEEWGRSVQGKIGLVTPNERSFYWRLTGRQNLIFFGSLYSLSGRALRSRVDEALADSGLEADAEKPYRLFSSGMKQKLNIARALLGDPELYLLDEPASHLDPLARIELWDFIARNLIGKRGATVFLCTHDLEEARKLADHVVILNKGRVVAQGSPSTLGGLGAMAAALELRFSGEAPARWLERNAGTATLSGPGRLVVRFDRDAVRQEDLIRDFILEGGALTEARRIEADLLEALERGVRGDA